jgi:hypothetical protein
LKVFLGIEAAEDAPTQASRLDTASRKTRTDGGRGFGEVITIP